MVYETKILESGYEVKHKVICTTHYIVYFYSMRGGQMYQRIIPWAKITVNIPKPNLGLIETPQIICMLFF